MSTALDVATIPRPTPGQGANYPAPSERDYTPFGMLRTNWWRRVLSSFLDTLITTLPISVVFLVARAGTHDDDVINRLALANAALVVVLDAVYTTVLLGRGRGRTFGNRAAGISVRDAVSGELLDVRVAFVRWFTHRSLLALVIPGLVCDLWPLWDARRQSLADRVAATTVVREL